MNKLNIGSRMGAMLMDHMIMTLVIFIFAAPGVVYDVMDQINNQGIQHKLMAGNLYLNIFAFSLYFNKDIYFGRSPAKRILDFQIVNNKTNLPAGPLRCLVRNLTIPLWPIEVVVSLINNERRIGDFIAGTRFSVYNAEQNQKADWTFIGISVVASMAWTYFVFIFPMEILFKDSGILVH